MFTAVIIKHNNKQSNKQQYTCDNITSYMFHGMFSAVAVSTVPLFSLHISINIAKVEPFLTFLCFTLNHWISIIRTSAVAIHFNFNSLGFTNSSVSYNWKRSHFLCRLKDNHRGGSSF